MRWVGRHQPPVGIQNQHNVHGPRHADNEGEDGHNNECHEGTGIHQLGQVSSVDELTFHSAGNFFPPLPAKF